MKVLLTGGSGQVGHALQSTVPEEYSIVAPDRSLLDMATPASLVDALHNYAPDALINSAAYTAVDKAEQEPDLAKRVNARAAGELARYCAQQEIPMVQISTDFVFDGKSTTPYSTDAPVQPLGVYGSTKLGGEILVQENHPAAYIVRASWIYGEHGSNFVKTMLRLGGEGKSLRVVDDQIGSPTYATNLAKFIWQLLDVRPAQHILHCSDAGQLSWYDFARTIFAEAHTAGLLAQSPDISACSTAEFGAPAPRPAYSVLECQPSFTLLGLEQADWLNSLRAMLANLEKGPV